MYTQTKNMPAWAHGDAIVFFSAAETYETRTAYEEWKFSLPRELTSSQQMDAAMDFLHAAFGETHPHVWAFHDPLASDGGHQPHVHVLWSARTLDKHDRSAHQFFRRYQREHPDRGGAEKNRRLGHYGAVKAARIQYTDIMNLHLEEAGRWERLHPGTLLSRGILREPEPRLDPSDSNAFKFHQEVTPKMSKVFAHRQARKPDITGEQGQARKYWDARKQELGITTQMTHAAKLYAITHARTQRALDIPARPHLSLEVAAEIRQRRAQTLERQLTRQAASLSHEDDHARSGRVLAPDLHGEQRRDYGHSF